MLSKKAKRRRRQATQLVEINRLKSADYASEWLSDARPTCPWCGLPSSTTKERPDPYLNCVYGDGSAEAEAHPFMMVSCEACWWDRYLET